MRVRPLPGNMAEPRTFDCYLLEEVLSLFVVRAHNRPHHIELGCTPGHSGWQCICLRSARKRTFRHNFGFVDPHIIHGDLHIYTLMLHNDVIKLEGVISGNDLHIAQTFIKACNNNLVPLPGSFGPTCRNCRWRWNRNLADQPARELSVIGARVTQIAGLHVDGLPRTSATLRLPSFGILLKRPTRLRWMSPS